jgi:hypothetical protein
MIRTIGRLTALKAEKAKRPGMYADGGGLYLRITNEGTKNWVYRFMLNGRPRWMGIDPLAGLQEARGKALDARRLRHEGIDPIDARRAGHMQGLLEAAKAITFNHRFGIITRCQFERSFAPLEKYRSYSSSGIRNGR